MTAAPIRYALAANTAQGVADMTLLERSAQVTTLSGTLNPTDLGEKFEIIAAYGTYTDATQSPTSVNYALVINIGLTPLDSIANLLPQSIDPASITELLGIPGAQPFSKDITMSQTTLRTELANTGWPDGIDILFANDQAVGVDATSTYFARSGLRLIPVPRQSSMNHTHLALVSWTTDDERQGWVEWAGADSPMIDLFTLPISYWAIPDLTITYSPQGWPVPARP
jgi:hypothetical protein